jgi:environmental stress-induced protein Ves
MNGARTHSAVIRTADQPVATWRGGIIRAIVAEPPTKLGDLAAAHLWAGTATIERDGPYSVFANRMRIHLPLRGNGLQLHFQEPTETIVLAPFDQATFAGDRPLTVTLVDGAVEAFNLIFAPTVAAELTVYRLTATEPASQLPALPIAPGHALQLLYAVNGPVDVAVGEETVTLAGGDAYVRRAGEALRFQRVGSDVDVVYVYCYLND